MTRISCDVKKCVYNADGGCSLEAIKVGGESARVSDDTMCRSYTPGEKSATNSCKCDGDGACDISEISCSAEKC